MHRIDSLLHLSAIGIYFHAVYVSITLGFPIAIMALLRAYGKTGNEVYMKAAKTMTYVVAINFTMGAITGTLVEFGLVQVWPGTLLVIASSAFAPLTLELIAFANEIALLVLFIVTLGRIRVSKSIVIIASYWVFAALSGVLITMVNSWLISPWGTGSIPRAIYPFMPVYGPLEMDIQKVISLKIISLASGYPLQEILERPGASEAIGIFLRDSLIAFKNPYAISSAIHNVTAALIVGLSIALLGYALRYWKTKDEQYKYVIRAFLPFLALLLIIQPTIIGHYMGVSVVEYNPTKFALIEGAIETKKNPIVGLLAYGDPDHPIIGFDELKKKCLAHEDSTLGDLANRYGINEEKLLSLAEKLGLTISGDDLRYTLSTRLSELCLRDLEASMTRGKTLYPIYYTKLASGILAFITVIILLSLFFKLPILSRVSSFIFRDIMKMKEDTLIISLALAVFVGSALSAAIGWFVREVGRKPWTVYGLFYPSEVATTVDYATSQSFVLLASLVIIVINLAGILAMYIIVSRKQKTVEISMRGGEK